jgi:hypothetical protein
MVGEYEDFDVMLWLIITSHSKICTKRIQKPLFSLLINSLIYPTTVYPISQ